MQVFVAILVLYGQVFAPWLCCCATSSVINRLIPHQVNAETNSEAVPTFQTDSVCKECCQKFKSQTLLPNQTDPVKRVPCPIQVKLIESQPTPLIERSNISFDNWLAVSFAFSAIEPINQLALPVVEIRSLDVGPALLMSVLRLKYHHCLLC